MNKKEHLQKIKLDLDNISHQMAILKNDVKRGGIEATDEAKNTLADLEKRNADLEAKYTAIKDAGEESWKSLVSGLEKSWKEFQTALKTAKDKLIKK